MHFVGAFGVKLLATLPQTPISLLDGKEVHDLSNCKKEFLCYALGDLCQPNLVIYMARNEGWPSPVSSVRKTCLPQCLPSVFARASLYTPLPKSYTSPTAPKPTPVKKAAATQIDA